MENLNFDMGQDVTTASDTSVSANVAETSGVGTLTEEQKIELKKQAENFKNLPLLEQIKYVVGQKGIETKEPKKHCKQCNGTGIEKMNDVPLDEGKVEQVPIACHCIFKEEDYHAVFGPIHWGRKVVRKAMKGQDKENSKKRMNSFANELKQKQKKEKKRKNKNKRKIRR